MSLPNPFKMRLLPHPHSTIPVSSGRLSLRGAPTGMIPLKLCGHGSHFGPSILVRLLFMRHISVLLLTAWAGFLGLAPGFAAAAVEWNPVRSHPVEIGPQASRLLVGFRATPANSTMKEIRSRAKAQVVRVTQAQTSQADVASLVQRNGMAMAGLRQFLPGMHVVLLRETLYGADVAAALEKLRADSSVAFADVDERRYPHAPRALPNDPL